MFLPFILLLLSTARASSPQEARDLFDRTYARDNTFCKLEQQTVEFQLRGNSRYTEPAEKATGQSAFYKNLKGQYVPLKLGSDQSGTYRFFKKNESLCSKSAGFQLDQDQLAVIFQKENRPFKSKLVIQIFDMKSLEPRELQETNFETSQVEALMPQGFAFNVIPEREELLSGNISIKDTPYQYQDRHLVMWYQFGLKNNKPLPQLVYEKFPWKHLFSNQAAFMQAAGWNDPTEKFIKPVIFFAVNHQQKKECILFSAQKIKPDGSESWFCGDMLARVD